MDTTTDIRRRNFCLLVEEVGGLSRMAGKLGKSPSQLSQISNNSPTRGIGPRLAREIEIKLELEIGWLDIPHYLPMHRARAFMEKWQQLPPAMRKQVEDYVDIQLKSLTKEEREEKDNTDFSRIYKSNKY